MYPFQPFSDRVLVRRDTEASAPTKHGLSIPDSGKEKPQEGEVLAVGPGHLVESGFLMPLQCEVGDHIYFAKFAGVEITLGGETLILMHESELLGKPITLNPITPPDTLDDIPY